MSKINTGVARRARPARLRAKVVGTAERPRLCVFRSLNHIYVQVIDDKLGHTLSSASTLEEGLSQQGQKKAVEAAAVGTLVAERALQAGIKQVVFDRGGYKYHGRVKQLAEAARKAGLEF
jgi:large subunit ribosomal protein L18